MNICYKEIKSDELHDDMLIYHNRYQYVQNDWYPDKNGGYYLVHQPHVENWDDKRKREIVSNLRSLLNNGGKLFGAYDEEKLIGFSALDGVLFGSKNQYLDLVWFHVSYEYRGNHIGKKLFHLCIEAAAQYVCSKIYIVASSSEESQKAYHKLGCIYAKEHISHLYERRPDAVHMEYLLY
jgi:ribosomal protein S18 acetylase RimI-like enzyme